MSKEESKQTVDGATQNAKAEDEKTVAKKDKPIAPKPVPEVNSEPKNIKNKKTGAVGTVVRIHIHKGNKRLDRVEVNCDGKMSNMIEKKFRENYEFI